MRSDRRVVLDASPAQVWATLEQVDRYRSWWPWLRRLEAERLAAGEAWRCTVTPSLPYRVAFDVLLDEVAEETTVAATVRGDVVGAARIDLAPDGDGTALRLTADLQAANPWLRRLERWAPPVARVGHDQIIDGALAQLAQQVRIGAPGPGGGPARGGHPPS
ncbi:MAG: SRPBCC family protein [Aquihabitans sp.]